MSKASRASVWRESIHFFETFTPPAQALLIQCVALFITCLLVFIKNLALPSDWILVEMVLTQSAIAYLLSVRTGMESWWHKINSGLPASIAIMSYVGLPHWVYLVGLVCTASVFWGIHKTRVPFFPSSNHVHKQVIHLLPKDSKFSMVDIGSGLGDLVIKVSKLQNASATGVEIAPVPWLVSKIRNLILGGKAKFKLGSYENLDLSQHDIVFAYLSPAVMQDVWLKAKREMKPGSRFISCEFDIPGHPCSIKIVTGGVPVYVWNM